MPKKREIIIRPEGDLTAIDDALDSAIADLDGANENVKRLLESLEPPPPPPDPQAGEAQPQSEDPPTPGQGYPV